MFALHEFRIGPKRADFDEVEKQTGRTPPEAINPEPYPDALEYIWEWFGELSRTRGGGWGPGPITYLEIDAWARLTSNSPEPWEVALIRKLDTAWLVAESERTKK